MESEEQHTFNTICYFHESENPVLNSNFYILIVDACNQ